MLDACVVDGSVVDASDEAHTKVDAGDFLIGPVNDPTFLKLTESLRKSLCGPFANERAFLKAFEYRNECEGTKVLNRLHRRPIGRVSKFTMSSGRCTRPESTLRLHSTLPTQISAPQT